MINQEETMDIDTTIGKIGNANTMPELDALRTETAEAMMGGGKEVFSRVQGAFRKAKNRLKRIPLRDRTWGAWPTGAGRKAAKEKLASGMNCKK